MSSLPMQTPMSRSLFDLQSRLSEQLRLLSQLDYVDPYIRRRQGFTLPRPLASGLSSPKVQAEFRTLNTIALMLASSQPGDSTAVTIEKRESLCLALAKHRAPTAEDEAVASCFMGMLADPRADDPKHMFSFVHAHCLRNLNTFITKLHKSLLTFRDVPHPSPDYGGFPTDQQFVLLHWTPDVASLEKEFPHPSVDKEFLAGLDEPTFEAMLSHLVNECIQASSLALDAHNVGVAVQQYMNLAAVAEPLLKARFLKSFAINFFDGFERRRRFDDLRDYLFKICEYSSGLKRLRSQVKRWFQGGKVPFRWVDEGCIPKSGAGRIPLPEVRDVLERTFESPPDPQTIDEFRSCVADFDSLWGRDQAIEACIHPEIRLIFSLGKGDEPRTPEQIMELPKAERRFIGSSEESCLCCSLWIEAYNFAFGTAWLSRGYNGKIDTSWAFPSLPSIGGSDRRGAVGGAVLEGIQHRLTEVLCTRFPHQPQKQFEIPGKDLIDPEEQHDAFLLSIVNLPKPY